MEIKNIGRNNEDQNGLNTVHNWYRVHFPTDNLGKEIPRQLTFNEVFKGMQRGIDIYDMLGDASDSVVRERVFEELATRNNVSYDTIYDLWLDSCVETAMENNPMNRPKIVFER